MHRRMLVAFGLLSATVLTLVALPLAVAFRTIPVSPLGTAYTLGARLALTSDHVNAIARGETPAVNFRRSDYDMANKYVWQQAKLTRSGNCLDTLTPAGAPRPLSSVCQPRNQLVEQPERLYFKVGGAGAVTMGGYTRAPTDGRKLARGAMFQIEGEIGVGRTFETASFYKLELDATELDPSDLTDQSRAPKDQRESLHAEECDRLQPVKLRTFPLSALPRVLVKLCRYRAKDDKRLALVQYQSGLPQLTRWSDVVMCKDLLAQVLKAPRRADVAGCLGAHWNARERVDLSFVLFEVRPEGTFALLP
jgi:hypothetical protein